MFVVVVVGWSFAGVLLVSGISVDIVVCCRLLLLLFFLVVVVSRVGAVGHDSG